MGYREFPVPLGGLAECGWSSSAGPAPAEHAVLPDGAMDLVWTGADLLVAGPDTAPHPVRSGPGAVATGLRFRPGALPALLGVPADALLDHRVPLADLLPRPAGRALARIGAGEPVLDALLGAVADLPGAPPDRALGVVVRHAVAGAGAAATADALGWTSRTLHRRALAAFGYGPAVLRRVLRFRRAVDLLHAGVAPAEVAVRAGYADQPHLSREVRALAGRSPAQLGA